MLFAPGTRLSARDLECFEENAFLEEDDLDEECERIHFARRLHNVRDDECFEPHEAIEIPASAVPKVTAKTKLKFTARDSEVLDADDLLALAPPAVVRRPSGRDAEFE